MTAPSPLPGTRELERLEEVKTFNVPVDSEHKYVTTCSHCLLPCLQRAFKVHAPYLGPLPTLAGQRCSRYGHLGLPTIEPSS